jgi:haloalkane dehalogenase
VTITENTIEINSQQWFYRQAAPTSESDKPPVILLHGLPSHSYTWREVMPFLAEKGLRAIAPDWLGFGASAKPSLRDFSYTTDACACALSDFLETLGIQRLSLVVQGFLGSAGIQYALRHPQRIERLIILNTPLSTAAKLPWQMQQWGLPLIGEMVTQDPLLVDRTLEKGSGFVIADGDLAVHRQPFLKTSAVGRALAGTIRRLNLPEAMAELEAGFSTWEVPTLIIWGMADSWLSSEAAERLARDRQNVELVRLSEAQHYPQEHWSQEISPRIVNFLYRQIP